MSGMAGLRFAQAQEAQTGSLSTRDLYLDARAFAERWLALAPDDADGLQLAASIEQKLGDNAAASRYLSRLQAIPLGPTPAPRAQ